MDEAKNTHIAGGQKPRSRRNSDIARNANVAPLSPDGKTTSARMEETFGRCLSPPQKEGLSASSFDPARIIMYVAVCLRERRSCARTRVAILVQLKVEFLPIFLVPGQA